jgi:tetratricopeptide (TPR) repeat protein
MPIATRTFRVFVSSTFEDLKEERHALQRDVFPKLRTLCEQHGARFQAIDLRWGVRDEAGLDQQTMEICLREIERCQRTRVKPNFIVLLGDRYGWQPLPPRIPASEFEALLPHIQPTRVRSLAEQWYRLDMNAVPPECCLEPRTGEFVDPAAWDRVEQPLRQALANAARSAGLPEREIIKYEASATHQEILAGLGETEADRQHVFGFFRRPKVQTAADHSDAAPGLTGCGKTPSADNHPGAFDATPPESGGEPEKSSPPQMRRGGAQSAGVVLKRGSADHDSANQTFRSPESPAFGDPGEDGASAAEETDPRIENLKWYLRARLPGNIEEFDRGETAKLCNDVYARVKQVIESEVKRFEDRPALDLEVEAHNRFAEERSRIFIGRQGVLETIAEYLRGSERRPLVLHGESGSGKSAVMARASQQYEGPGRVIRRFIGASPESASGHALLTSLCRQIAPGDTPVDYAQLENAFKERLSVATEEQPLILFIDALDQLASSDPAREATWLPPELPPHVKVVVSTTNDGERLPEGLAILLERMAKSEAGEALDELLKGTSPEDAGRRLQPWQRETVLAHFERCGLPLYLKLAEEESRLWKSYAPREDCTLGENVAGVIDTLFDRLSSNANHGPVLVERSLGYLAAARFGLTEDEILDVLTADDAVWNDFSEREHHEVSERRLPVVVWSRLLLDLEPYLTERAAPGGTVITFYHRQLAKSVSERFLAEDKLLMTHADLARYFDEQELAPRQISELPWQLAEATEWHRLFDVLARPQFFVAAWDASEYDLKSYWHKIEVHSPLRMTEAYQPLLDAEDEAGGDPAILSRLAGLFRDTGQPDVAKRCYRKLLWFLRDIPVESVGFMLASIYLELAHLEFATNNREAGERWLNRSRSLSLGPRDPRIVLKGLFEAGLQAKKRRQWWQAMELYDKAIDMALQLNERKMLARLYNNVGNVEKNVNLLTRSTHHFKLGAELARAEADPETESRCLHGLGDVAQMQGNLEEARRRYEAALEIKTKLGDREGMAKCVLGLGNVALSLSGLEQAQVHYDRAIQMAPNDRELELVICENTAKALVAREPPAAPVNEEVEALLWRCYCLRRELGLETPEYLRELFGV